MSFTESIAAARAFVRPGDPPLDANRELVATGLANLGGALLGGMPAGGGTSQTGVVRAAGGRTQVASLVTAGAALATMLFLAPILSLLPQATLAAIVIVYSASLIQPEEFRAIYNVRHMEFRWAIVAALGVLVFGTLQALSWRSCSRSSALPSRPPIRGSRSLSASGGPMSCAPCLRSTPTTRRSRAF